MAGGTEGLLTRNSGSREPARGGAFRSIANVSTQAQDRGIHAGTAIGRIWISGAGLPDAARGFDSPCCSMFAVGTPVR